MSDTRQIGTINERGYINGFERRGFTPSKCLSELIANVMDSMDKVHIDDHRYVKKCLFEVNRTCIKMIDNGSGMNEASLDKMYEMHSENHKTETSRGVSGIGSKPSQFILSDKTEVRVYTRCLNGEYLCAIAPWGIIQHEGVYTGKISTRKQTAEEKLQFVQDRSRYGMLSDGDAFGTTTEFKYNPMLSDLIESAFKDTDTISNPQERLGVIFGRDEVEILYKNHDDVNLVPLKMFNYFGANPSDYYGGIAENQIQQWYSERQKKYRYIWNDGSNEFEIKSVGKGFATEISVKDENMNGYSRVGTYTVLTGLRKDPHIYDLDTPTFALKENGTFGGPLTADNKKHYSSYTKEFIGDNEKYLTHAKLVRNNQEIGLIPPEVKIASARADGCQYLKIRLVQCEVYFNPVSAHTNNHQDRVMNVQENKNQLDGDTLPRNFTRLVAAIKEDKALEIWTQLSNAASAAYNVSLVPVVPVVPEPPVPVPEPPAPVPEPPVPVPEPPVPEPPVPGPEPVSDSDSDSQSTLSIDSPVPLNGISGRAILKELRTVLSKIDEGTLYSGDSLEAHLYTYLCEFNDPAYA